MDLAEAIAVNRKRIEQLEAENAALKTDYARLEAAHDGCADPEQLRQERAARVQAEADLAEMRKTEAATRRDCTAAINWAEQLEAELEVLRKGKP